MEGGEKREESGERRGWREESEERRMETGEKGAGRLSKRRKDQDRENRKVAAQGGNDSIRQDVHRQIGRISIERRGVEATCHGVK